MNARVNFELQNYYQKLEVYEALDWKEKEAVDLLMIEQLRLKPSERISFGQIISRVKNEKKVVKISDDIYAELQTKALMNEVEIYATSKQLEELILLNNTNALSIQKFKSRIRKVINN